MQLFACVDTVPLLDIKANGLMGDWSSERFDALTSALRRGDRAEALTIIDRWPHYVDWSRKGRWRAVEDLTRWLMRETRLHVEGVRFNHALALVERYAQRPMPLDARHAKHLDSTRSEDR